MRGTRTELMIEIGRPTREAGEWTLIVEPLSAVCPPR